MKQKHGEWHQNRKLKKMFLSLNVLPRHFRRDLNDSFTGINGILLIANIRRLSAIFMRSANVRKALFQGRCLTITYVLLWVRHGSVHNGGNCVICFSYFYMKHSHSGAGCHTRLMNAVVRRAQSKLMLQSPRSAGGYMRGDNMHCTLH